MSVPSWITILICLVTFLVALFEYYRADPEKRVLNPYFGLAIVAIVMLVVNVFSHDAGLSGWLFILAVVWCGLTLYQLRSLPQRPEERS